MDNSERITKIEWLDSKGLLLWEAVTSDKVQGHAIDINKTEKEALWEILNRYGKEDGPAIWLPTDIRGRVKYTTWTPAGNMRDCYWVHFEV